MSTAQFTIPLITVIPGQLITASLWNNEFNNLDTNLNPDGIGAYSDTDSQMQTTTDPYPSGATSRPTAISGEIQRIRYILNLIIGQTYWYQHPSISLETLNTSTPVIPSGTKMVFFQAAAPTGWTQDATNNDKALRVVSSTGGGTGGSHALSTAISLAHTHTVASHTHDLANHTHTIGGHTHGTPSHVHRIDYSSLTNATISTATGGDAVSADSDGSFIGTTTSEGAGSAARKLKNQTLSGDGSGNTGAPSADPTGTPSVNTSGTATPATDSQLTDVTLAYVDVIVCSKN